MSSDESEDNDFVVKEGDELSGGSGGDSDDGMSDDEEVSPKKSKKSLKRKIGSDSEEEDDDDDKDGEEDSEEDGSEGEMVSKKSKKKTKNKKAKKKRARGLDFILQDVDVDDDEGDDDDYEDDEARDLEPNEKEEAERYMKELETDRHRTDRDKFANMSVEEVGRYFENKYKSSSTRDHVINDEDSAIDEISQNGILPSTKEPNLWIVKCRMGEEKLVALQLMRKHIAYENTQDPLQIKSVVVKEGLKGMIYIESFKQSHVASAIEGISALNQFNITMVPIKDMVDVLRVVKDIPQLKINSYVRIKRALYKDDLAQVDLVDIAQNKVNLKLVPRIDYQKKRGAMRSENDKNYKIKRRPAAKLFDIDAVKEIGGEVTADGDFVIFEGNHYRRGFLYKYFPINAVLAEGVKPTLAELDKFQENSDDLKKELESTSIKETTNPFVPGDIVEVKSGELVNLRGKVQTIDGSKVVLIPEQEGLKDPITMNAYELRKFFKDGDHVKVIGGRYEGQTGLIIRNADNHVIMISDLGMDELKVRAQDLQLCADVATGVDSLGQFQYHDLVQIDQTGTVGVIVRLEKEHLEVLNTMGKVVRIKPQAIVCKRDNKMVRALDNQSNSIESKDTVKIIDGPFAKDRETEEEPIGEVRYVHRGFAFVYMRKQTQNGGIIVCRSKHLLLQGAKRNEMPMLNRMQSPNPMASPRHAGSATPRASQDTSSVGSRSVGGQTPRIGGFQNNANFGTAANTRVRRDNAIIGKNVRVTMGPLKGYFGIVRDATEDTIRLELHTMCKTISVDRARIMVVSDSGSGVGPSPGASTLYAKTPSYDKSYGSKTPLHGAMTPLHGSMTPYGGDRTPFGGDRTPGYDSHGGRTPGYDSHGGRTPGYESHGGRTPAYESSASGRTPAYESRTPAYDSGSARTPSYEMGGGASSNNSRTPAYESRTPAYDSSSGRTPSYESTNRTPAYESGRTPSYRTPAYDSGGGRTPAYDSVPSRTPAYDNFDAMSTGGRTPAYENSTSARTPAYDSSNNFEPESPTFTPSDSEDEEKAERSPVYDSPASPTYLAPTPGANLNPATPNFSIDSVSNFAAPMTPGSGLYNDYAAPSPYVPSYGAVHRSEETNIPQHFLSRGEWIKENMYVTIVDHETRYNDREAVVADVISRNRRVALYVPDFKENIDANFDQVVPLRPHTGDLSAVIYGEEAGFVGFVSSIDGSEAVIRDASNSSNLKLVNIGLCCRMAD